MISPEEAQARLLALAPPLGEEIVGLDSAVSRYLASNIAALRTQPAKDLSAMDGYALSAASMPGPWKVIGESPAGGSFDGKVAGSEAVRIFTGAPLPAGTDCILIQENALRDGDQLSLAESITLTHGQHVRKTGSDFSQGDALIEAETCLNAAHIGLAAISGHGSLPVHRVPRVCLLSTGDELVEPGQILGENQIPASNDVMLAAMLENQPCVVTAGGIVPDRIEALENALRSADADIIVTIGGASVGDHDLVRPALDNIGAEMEFFKVAMRPGKPVMAGKLGERVVIGLPGNPVSAYVTAFLFLLPLIRHLAGSKSPMPVKRTARIKQALPANGGRANFIRARLDGDTIAPLPSKDSAMLAVLAKADALIYRQASAPVAGAGEQVEYFALD